MSNLTPISLVNADKLNDLESYLAKEVQLGTYLRNLALKANVNALTVSYGGAHADKVLTTAECYNEIFNCISADQAVSLVFPNEDKIACVYNNTGYALTVKVSGATGVTIPQGAKEILYISTDVVRPGQIPPVVEGIALSADVTLTSLQYQAKVLEVTTGHASNAIIAPNVKGYTFVVINNDAALSAWIKKVGGAAVEIPPSSVMTVRHNGTNYVALTSYNAQRFNVGQQAAHDYAGAAVAWTLTNLEKNAALLVVTNANGAADIIAPAEAGRRYYVRNASGQAITVKKSGSTGIVVANAKTATVEYYGSDYVRLTADQTH